MASQVSQINLQSISRKLNQIYYKSGIGNREAANVFEKDWDNLLLLDACRYDMFDHSCQIKGDLTAIRSGGSYTKGFLKHNVPNSDLQDTVYVTANPILYRHQNDIQDNFHHKIEVWYEDGWDDIYNTVRPETMVEFTIDAAERFPNKRLFVHFIQPHFPFLTDAVDFDKQTPDPEEPGSNFWDEVAFGRLDVDTEAVWEAYNENLSIVLESLQELLPHLRGKTVITSDHGNMINERSFPIPNREWGHPPGIHTDALTLVPWLELPTDERRKIRAGDEMDEESKIDDQTVIDRLENLGYAE